MGVVSGVGRGGEGGWREQGVEEKEREKEREMVRLPQLLI